VNLFIHHKKDINFGDMLFDFVLTEPIANVNHVPVEGGNVFTDLLQFVVLAKVPKKDLAVAVDTSGIILDLDHI
jgi:hypothetical protein